jgi:hypothetical protein
MIDPLQRPVYGTHKKEKKLEHNFLASQKYKKEKNKIKTTRYCSRGRLFPCPSFSSFILFYASAVAGLSRAQSTQETQNSEKC